MKRKSFVISYDLAEGGNYDELFNHIKSYGYWAHITESTWAVLSTKTASEIRDEIAEHLSEGSRLCLIREKVVTFRMVKLNLLLSIFLITK